MNDRDVGDPSAAFDEWGSEADEQAFAELATDVASPSAASGAEAET